MTCCTAGVASGDGMVTDRLCGAAMAGTPSTAGVIWAMVDCWPKASVEPPISVKNNATTAAVTCGDEAIDLGGRCACKGRF